MVLPRDKPSPRISATAGSPASGLSSIRRLSRLEIRDKPSPRISATAGSPASGLSSIRRLSRLEMLLIVTTLVLLKLNLSADQLVPAQQTNNKYPELLSDTNANGSRAPMFPVQQQQCLGLDPNQGNASHDMDSLVASANQIFITMPAKAGGSSMKSKFAQFYFL